LLAGRDSLPDVRRLGSVPRCICGGYDVEDRGGTCPLASIAGPGSGRDARARCFAAPSARQAAGRSIPVRRRIHGTPSLLPLLSGRQPSSRVAPEGTPNGDECTAARFGLAPARELTNGR